MTGEYRQVGDNVRAERARRRWSLRRTAVEIGLSRFVLERIESQNICTTSEAEQIAAAFGMHPAVLVGWVSPENAGLLMGDGLPGHHAAIESSLVPDNPSRPAGLDAGEPPSRVA